METEKSGFYVAQVASKQPYRPAIAILTAYTDLGADWNMYGVDSLFIKPTNTEELPEKVKVLIAARKNEIQADNNLGARLAERVEERSKLFPAKSARVTEGSCCGVAPYMPVFSFMSSECEKCSLQPQRAEDAISPTNAGALRQGAPRGILTCRSADLMVVRRYVNACSRRLDSA